MPGIRRTSSGARRSVAMGWGGARVADAVAPGTPCEMRWARAGPRLAAAGPPPLHAAQLQLPHRWASQLRRPSVRRAVAVLLATLADERAIVAYSGLTGTIDALRGGTYVVGQDQAVRFEAARVVTDATANGTQQKSRHGRRARLHLHGRGVPRSRLVLRSGERTTHITGTVGRRHVDVRVKK